MGAASVAGPVSALQTTRPAGSATASGTYRVCPKVRPAIVQLAPDDAELVVASGCRPSITGSGMKGKLSQTTNPMSSKAPDGKQGIAPGEQPPAPGHLLRPFPAAPGMATPTPAALAHRHWRRLRYRHQRWRWWGWWTLTSARSGHSKGRRDSLGNIPPPAFIGGSCRRRSASLHIPQLGIQPVAQPVAQQVHGQHRQHDGHSGEKEQPPRRYNQRPPPGNHQAPSRRRLDQAGAQET